MKVDTGFTIIFETTTRFKPPLWEGAIPDYRPVASAHPADPRLPLPQTRISTDTHFWRHSDIGFRKVCLQNLRSVNRA